MLVLSRGGDGSFHVKAAGLAGDPGYFAAKTNANYPQNPSRFGLPTALAGGAIAGALRSRVCELPGVRAALCGLGWGR